MSVTANYPNAKILAVDDEPVNLLILEDILEDYYLLETAENGQDCFDKLTESVPDLILLDVNMPSMNGFDVLQKLKQDQATKEVPVIFLTAMLSSEDQRTGLQLGAVDYITKPFTESILLARINTHLKLGNTTRELQFSNRILQQERDFIEHILISMRYDMRFEPRNIRQLLSPVEKTNGDITLSASNPNNHHHLLVGDFTGHGLTAAIAGPLVSSLFYSNVHGNLYADKVLKLINHELFNKMPTESFLAATYVEWKQAKRKLYIYNFAMPPAIIIKADGTVLYAESTQLPLGVIDGDNDFYPSVFDFFEGDKLYVFTDGIVEAKNQHGELYGINALQQKLMTIRDSSDELERLLEYLDEFTGGESYADDVTIVELSAEVEKYSSTHRKTDDLLS